MRGEVPTRRLVDVSQDVIIREDDCGTDRGFVMPIAVRLESGALRQHDDVETSVYARTLVDDVTGPDGEVLAESGIDLGIEPTRREVVQCVGDMYSNVTRELTALPIRCATCANGRADDSGA